MGDSDASSGRFAAASSRPGIRVIELHFLGMQIQLLSINVGRGWPPLGSCWSPSNATHWRVDRTITVQRRQSLANRCGGNDLIKQRQLLLPLSKVFEGLKAMWS
jgi:hypothetical protein